MVGIDRTPPLPEHAQGRLSPRERMRTALTHQQPDRVPFTWGFGPTPEMTVILRNQLAERGIDWAKLAAVTCDKIVIAPDWIGPPLPDANTFTGIWGINLKRATYEGGAYEEFTDFPLAGMTREAELDAHAWPSVEHYDYEQLRNQAKRGNPCRLRAIQYFAGNPFEIYCWMTGLEEAMMNLAMQPELVRHALDHIVGFMEERLRRVLREIGDLIDIVFLADDLGSQNGLLMSRRMYVEVLQPYHARICAAVRELAPEAFCMMHSDGAVFDILPDLIDAGVQVLEAVQTDATGMQPERLKRDFGDRLAFHGAISVQHLLPHEPAAIVYSQCRRLVQVLGESGGYIAAPSHAIQIGTPPENVLAMLRAVLGETDFAEALRHARALPL